MKQGATLIVTTWRLVMKNISHTEFLQKNSWPITHRFEKVVVFLEHSYTVKVKKLADQQLHLLPLHNFNCQPSLEFLEYILKIIVEISELPEESFQISSAILYDDSESGLAKPAAVIITNDGIHIPEDKYQEIEYGISIFCESIFRRQGADQQQSS